jgi:hypothetical protein
MAAARNKPILTENPNADNKIFRNRQRRINCAENGRKLNQPIEEARFAEQGRRDNR